MTQENSAKVSFILVVFLGLLTAITPLATDLYLPALPIMPSELNTSASNIQMTIGVMTFGVALGQLLLFTTWRVIFVILAIFSAILLVGSLLFRESLPKEKRVTGGVATATKNYITLIKDKRFLGQTLIQFFAFGGFFAYISGSSFVYQNIFQLSAQEFSYLFGINSCGIILASAISARLSNVITVRQLLTFALWQLTIGSLLFLIAMLFEWPLIPVTAILFFTVCTVSLFGSASFSMAMAKYGKMAGSASAVLGFASMFSAGIVSPLVGIGGEYTGIPMGITMLVCAVLSLLCLYGLVEKD